APIVRTVPAPPEPSLVDQFLDQPAYIGAAIGVLIIIGGLAVRAVRRRRESKSDAEESGPARGFSETRGLTYGALAGAGKGDGSNEAAAPSSDEVDPIAEAEIFLAYGRDAQAEELLKEALESSPRSNEIRLKLLQIYANRKDARAFEQVARDLQQGTGGTGPLWDQAVALGYQVDPDNARYAGGRVAAGAVAAAASAAAAHSAAENVDFNIGSEDATAITATDIDLGDDVSVFDRTQIFDPAESENETAPSFERAAAPAMDFNMDVPAAELSASHERAPARSASGLDFDIDLNSLTSAPVTSPAASQPSTGGLDFDMSGLSLDTASEPRVESSAAPEIDLSGISLDLGTETAPSISPTGKDDHWYDVQTKFDLAKAYQEMGDKDGAREILKEVLAEGDSEQKNAAQSVLTSLDS
ncbi:MAG: FimV/HubP family polar landmark protein, partial [Betaproteobacteria bacterium]